MLISVITCTFNRADKIHTAFESLKSQTYTNFEWLIWDDASVDNTSEIVQSFIDSKPNFTIRYFKSNQNRGKHVGSSELMKVFKGELVAELDSDDAYSNPNVIQEMFNEYSLLTEDQRKEIFCIVGLCSDQYGKSLKYNDTISNHEDVDFVDQLLIQKRKFPSDLVPIMNRYFALQHYNYPIPKEHMPYFPEGVHYAKLRSIYKMRFVNKVWRKYYINTNDNITKTINPYCAYYRSLYWINDFYAKYSMQNMDFFAQHFNSLIYYSSECQRTYQDIENELTSVEAKKKLMSIKKDFKQSIKRFIHFKLVLTFKPFIKYFLIKLR